MYVLVLQLSGFMDLNILAVAAAAIFVVRTEPLMKVSTHYCYYYSTTTTTTVLLLQYCYYQDYILNHVVFLYVPAVVHIGARGDTGAG